MNTKGLKLTGTIIAVFVGIMRAFGGFSLLFSHANPTEICVGGGLTLIGVLLITTGIVFLINLSQKNPRTGLFVRLLTFEMIAFWIDGIVNGFLLYGAPQLSGQIINIVLLAVVVFCLWFKRK